MKRTICYFTLLISVFFLALNCPTRALAASSQLVIDGRTLLFARTQYTNSWGNTDTSMTYSGLLAANAKFAEAAKITSDAEAQLFYAVTRIGAFALENGTTPGLDTLRELAEAFGIFRTDEDLMDEDEPYGEPPELYDNPLLPDTTPSGEEMRAFLAGPVINLLTDALNNINSITDQGFNTILTQDEINDDDDTEIDFGDVLVARSMLYTFKAFIHIMSAYDINVDIRHIITLENAGVLQIQRDLLTAYEDLLRLHSGGTTSLDNAKQALINGINAFRDAVDFISTETDDQWDDLIYFDSDSEVGEARYILTQLTDIKNSLNNNTVAILTDIDEEWTITETGTGKQLVISIYKDKNGNLDDGNAWGLDNCDFLFCSAQVEEFTVDGSTAKITLQYGGECPGTATLTGTLITSGSYINDTLTGTITNGSFTNTNCSDPTSGFFTGELTDYEEETDQIDLNHLFGGRSYLDIRNTMPDYDVHDYVIAGTYPTPILGGLLPEITTETQLHQEDIEVFGDVAFDIPAKTITLDGTNDWSGISPVIVDQDWGGPLPANGDIDSLYVAHDSASDSLYWMMTLNSQSPAKQIFYNANFTTNPYFNEWWSPIYDSQASKDGSGTEVYSLHKHYQGETTTEPTAISDMGIGSVIGSVIEARLPLSLFDGKNYIGVYTYTWDDPNNTGDFVDYSSRLRLPTETISGSVSSSFAPGSGSIFIYARAANDPKSKLLGTAVLASTGGFTISGIPSGADVYLFARWDADDNGIKTFGDYVGSSEGTAYSPGEENAAIDIAQEIDDNFIRTKPGLYRVFGNTTFTIPDYYDGPWDPNEVSWGPGWEFIGEGSATKTFGMTGYYKNILIIWHSNSNFNFDAVEDLTANTAFGINANDNDSFDWNWISSGLKNFDIYDWNSSYLRGRPDGLYTRTEDWYGFALFEMPDNTGDNIPAGDGSRQLRVAHYLLGDLNLDGTADLGDAIIGLQTLTNSYHQPLAPGQDVNNDNRIGFPEVINILQTEAGLRAVGIE